MVVTDVDVDVDVDIRCRTLSWQQNHTQLWSEDRIDSSPSGRILINPHLTAFDGLFRGRRNGQSTSSAKLSQSR
jgi:hypothetical protein